MTRDEMIENLQELEMYLAEEIHFASHEHEVKVYRRWKATLEEIRSDLVVARMKDEDAKEQEWFEERMRQLRKDHDEMMRMTFERRTDVEEQEAGQHD